MTTTHIINLFGFVMCGITALHSFGCERNYNAGIAWLVLTLINLSFMLVSP